MTTSMPYTLSSGVSGPATASAQPRPEPMAAASSGGPSQAELRQAWEAYQGNFRGPLATVTTEQPDLNVLANRVKPMIHGGVDFLFGPVLKIGHKDAHAQAILDATWGNDDKRMTTLAKTKINGGVYGHIFVKIVTPKKGQVSAENPPRLVVQNPELYRVETDPDDCELVTRYICEWQGADANGAPCHYRQTTTRIDPDDDDDTTAAGEDDDTHWEIQNWHKTGGAGGGERDWAPDGPPTDWPYEFAPIVDWQNFPNPNDHWGQRDADDTIVNLNKQLHLVESNTNAVMYSHGHPWLFGIGTDSQQMKPTPGSITDLPPGADVKAISATGDIPAMQSFAAQIRADMDEASSTPGVATGRMTELPKGALSGITVRLLYGPRIMRTEHERRLYGQGIRDLCRAVIVLCGQETAAQEDVELTWQDPLPQDDLAMAQMALALQQLGVSDHSIYALIGLNYDTEQEYKQQEAKDAMAAALQGAAMPQVGGGAMMGSEPDGDEMGGGMSGNQPMQQQPGQPVAPNGQSAPDPNHPAAKAAQAGMKAVGAAVKARNKITKGAQ